MAEYFSRGVLLTRRLPAEFGRRPIIVSPEGGLRYYRYDLNKVDPVLLNFAKQVNHDDVVWDIGANLGLFTFAAAVRSQNQVVAVEPDPFLVSVLNRSAAMALPGEAKISIFSAAVCDTVGQATLNIAKRARSANYLSGFGSPITGGSRATIQVPTVTLDSLLELFPVPRIVKIDIEGAELLALRGATSLLRAKPRLLIEVAGKNSPEVTDILRSSGYSLFDAEQNNRAVESSPFSTLAIA